MYRTQKIFRAVSTGEVDDWQQSGTFRTALNTHEAKQFFKTKDGAEILNLSFTMQYEITYNLQAFITLLPTDMGGRKNAVATGYKPSLVFNTHKNYCCEIELLDKIELKPDESAVVYIKLLAARTIPKNLAINDSFTLAEGKKAVGNGIIINEVVKTESTIEEVI